MERKSAWSLPMSEQEIVNEYKNAKKPQTQIAILADQNSCDKKTIVNILELNGCELPGNFKRKKKETPEAEAPEGLAKGFKIEILEDILMAGGGSGYGNDPVVITYGASEPAKEEPKEEPLPIAVHVRLAALRAIENMLPDNSGVEAVDFTERVIGILQLVKEAEHGSY